MLLRSHQLGIVRKTKISNFNSVLQYCFQDNDRERLMNYGTMPPRDPEMDLPPKYEECEELPPEYDAATMSPEEDWGARHSYQEPGPPSYSQVGHIFSQKRKCGDTCALIHCSDF